MPTLPTILPLPTTANTTMDGVIDSSTNISMFAAVAANADAMDEAEENTSPPTLTQTDAPVAKDSTLTDEPIDSNDNEEDDNFDPNDSMEEEDGAGEDEEEEVEVEEEEVIQLCSSSDEESEGGAVEEDEVEILLAQRELEDRQLMEEIFEEERDRVDGKDAEILGEGIFSDAQLDMFRMMHVSDNDGELVHKRTIIKQINQGRAISKSTDRTHRVRGVTKHGSRGASSSSRSIVGEAFNAAINDKHGGNSDADQHKTGDYCAIIVQSKQGEGSNASKRTFMVIAKFKQFGDPSVRVPLNSSWPTDTDVYCASVFILGLMSCTNESNEECLRPSDDIICTIMKVDSSCILPISPSIERIATDDNSIPVCMDVMTIQELNTAFDLLALRGKHHVVKDSNVQPVQLGDNLYFVATGNKAASHNFELFVCNICDPPQNIMRPTAKTLTPRFKDETEQQRALRNHMAAHQLKTPEKIRGNEPCGFCCGNCHAVVQVSRKNKTKIIEECASVLPSTVVLPNCQGYPSLLPFTFKSFKIVKNYPSTNQLAYCEKCDAFIWTYNLKKHNDVMHAATVRPSVYEDLLPSEAEKATIEKLYTLNS